MFSPSLAAHADQSPRSGYRGSDLVHWHERPVPAQRRVRQKLKGFLTCGYDLRTGQS
jgi:hypothetical protein